MLARITLLFILFVSLFSTHSLSANEEWFLTAPYSTDSGNTIDNMQGEIFYGSGVSEVLSEGNFWCTQYAWSRFPMTGLIAQLRKYGSIASETEQSLMKKSLKEYISNFYSLKENNWLDYRPEKRRFLGDCQRFYPSVQGFRYRLIDESNTTRKYQVFTSYNLTGSLLFAPLLAHDLNRHSVISAVYQKNFLWQSGGFLALFPRNTKIRGNSYDYRFSQYWHYNGIQKDVTVLLFPESSKIRFIGDLSLSFSFPIDTQIISLSTLSASWVETQKKIEKVQSSSLLQAPQEKDILYCAYVDSETWDLIYTSCILHLTDLTPEKVKTLSIKTR